MASTSSLLVLYVPSNFSSLSNSWQITCYLTQYFVLINDLLGIISSNGKMISAAQYKFVLAVIEDGDMRNNLPF